MQFDVLHYLPSMEGAVVRKKADGFANVVGKLGGGGLTALLN